MFCDWNRKSILDRMSSEKRHGKLNPQELGIAECGGVMEDKLGE